jgi:hypothetical protein
MADRTFSAIDALTIMRLFVKLERQMDVARQEGREEDEMELAQLSGALSYRIIGVSRFDERSPLSEERVAREVGAWRSGCN